MPVQKKQTSSTQDNNKRATYHPLARLAIRLSLISCFGYALAALTLILSFASRPGISTGVFVWAAFALTALMAAINIAGLAMGVIVLIKHRSRLDGSIAILYNILPFGLPALVFHHAMRSAH